MDTLRESSFLTAKTSAMVCWLFVGSAIFSSAFALLGGQQLVEQWVLSMNLTKTEFLLLSQVIIFILGWPLEWTEIIVIFMPIFVPLLDKFGVDPLFFGLLVALNLQTAFLSPPVAMAAFYLKGVSPPHVTLNQIFAGMMPFMGDPGRRDLPALHVPADRTVDPELGVREVSWMRRSPSPRRAAAESRFVRRIIRAPILPPSCRRSRVRSFRSSTSSAMSS